MKALVVIFSSIVCVVSFAQKAAVSLSVDTKSAQAGDLITFNVTSNIEGNVEINFPPEFILGYGTTNGMNQVMDYNTGKVTTVYYFSQNGAFKEDGNYTIQAFVKNKKTVFKSNKVTVKIEKEQVQSTDEVSKKAFKQPVFGIIKKSKEQIYEGEAIVLESKVFSRLNINMLESYNGFKVGNGAEQIELDKSQRLLLTKESFKGSNFLTFTYGKTVVFPNSAGKLKVNPFEMSLQYDDGGLFSDRIAFTSSGAWIEVLPLPANAPKDFIGAVGKFDFNYDLSKTNLKQGDVAVLTLVISGVGNLQNIDKPHLNLPKGIVIYGDPDVKEEFEYGMMGAEGKVTYTYNLQFNSSEIEDLNPISISYFDPSQKKYIQVKGAKINMNIKENPAFISSIKDLNTNEEQIEDENIPLLTNSSDSESDFYTSSLFWPTVLSPLFLGFLGGLFFVKNREASQSTNDKKAIRKGFQNLMLQIDEINLNQGGFQALEKVLKCIPNIYGASNQISYSKADLNAILKENQIEEHVIFQLNSILNKCEESRFSFQLDELHLKNLIQESKSVISEIHAKV